MTDTVPSVRKPRRSFLEQQKFNLEKVIALLDASHDKLAKAGFEVEGMNEVGMLRIVTKALEDGVQVTAVRSAGISVGDTVAVKEKFVPRYTVSNSGLEFDLDHMEVKTVAPGRGGYIIVKTGALIFKVAANHVKRV
jgi:hypothetical protein